MFFRKKEPVEYIPIIPDDDDFDIDLSGSDSSDPDDKDCIIVSVASNTGRVRSQNEDDFYAEGIGCRNKPDSVGKAVISGGFRRIFAVCDGMGGESYGEKASQIAVSELEKFADRIDKARLSSLTLIVNEYVNSANNRICRMAEEMRCQRSGSTLAMVCIDKETAYAFNIGDSRIYLFKNRRLTQISEDQTLAVKKLKANIYTEEEARKSPDSHKITSFLGVDNRGIGLKALSYDPINASGSMLLICSDGLTDMCSDDEIAGILSANSDNYAEALVNKAVGNGGKDNVTCIVIEVN